MNPVLTWILTLMQAWCAVAWFLLGVAWWVWSIGSQCFTVAVIVRWWWRSRS